MATPDWVKKELRANFAKASRAGQRTAKTEPRAAATTYLASDQALRIELTNGVSLTVPVRLIPSLQHTPAHDLRSVEVLGRGGGLHWESLDLDLSVPALVASLFAGSSWMTELGRIGGRRASAAKTAAARKNGRKGGRPRGRAATVARAWRDAEKRANRSLPEGLNGRAALPARHQPPGCARTGRETVAGRRR